MAYSHLDRAYDIAVARMEMVAPDLDSGGETAANALLVFVWYQRALGLWHLLARLDSSAYRACLARSGYAQLELLMLKRGNPALSGQTCCGSKVVGLASALAAGDLDIARKVALAMPTDHDPDWEYEDDFLFVTFLAKALLGASDEELGALLARWAVVTDGQLPAGAQACEMIVGRDQGAWPAAIRGYLEERAASLEAGRTSLTAQPETMATEGTVSMNGLALLRIAELRGLRTDEELPLCPRVAQLRPITGASPGSDWRKVLERA